MNMAKIQIKSERLTPFWGLFSIMEQFVEFVESTIKCNTILRINSKMPSKVITTFGGIFYPVLPYL